MTDPAVLNETGSLGLDNHVHAEPALVEAALGPNLLQPRERRRRQHREGKHIEEGANRNRGLHFKLGKQSRSKLLCDNGVSPAAGIGAVHIGVVLVDREVIRSARPSVTFRLKYAESAWSASPVSLLTVAPFGKRICTGGKSRPRRGGSTNAALQSSRLGKSLTAFALTTLPVSLSMSA